MKKLLIIATILFSIHTKSNAQLFTTAYYGAAFPIFDMSEELKNSYVGGEIRIGYLLYDKGNKAPYSLGFAVSNYTFDSKNNSQNNRNLGLDKLKDAKIATYTTTSILATLDYYIFENKITYGGWEMGYLSWKSEGDNASSGIPYNGGAFAFAPVLGGEVPINKNIAFSFRFNTMFAFTKENGYFNTFYSSAKLGLTFKLTKKNAKKESSK